MSDILGYAGEVTLAFGVHDRKASARWYGDNLGFELLYDVPEIGWCAMSTPVAGVVVGFSDVEEPTPGGPVPTFDVVDHDRARTRLEAAGVRFDGPPVEHTGLARLSTFYDPDGHALMLAQDLSQKD
ncbi:MAG TPA: VOC family protein [Gemmatimonadaceae bacterium]|nr:VOC family protein [Gemmatimonadaceae bacterium]